MGGANGLKDTRRSVFVEWKGSLIYDCDKFYDVLSSALPEGSKVFGYRITGQDCKGDYGAVIHFRDENSYAEMDYTYIYSQISVAIPGPDQTNADFIDY